MTHLSKKQVCRQICAFFIWGRCFSFCCLLWFLLIPVLFLWDQAQNLFQPFLFPFTVRRKRSSHSEQDLCGRASGDGVSIGVSAAELNSKCPKMYKNVQNVAQGPAHSSSHSPGRHPWKWAAPLPHCQQNLSSVKSLLQGRNSLLELYQLVDPSTIYPLIK